MHAGIDAGHDRSHGAARSRLTRRTLTAVTLLTSALVGVTAVSGPAGAVGGHDASGKAAWNKAGGSADARIRCRPGQDLIMNGGFELPRVDTSSAGWALVNEGGFQAWHTDDTSNQVEYWNATAMNVPAYRGQQFAELNATGSNVTIYQDVWTVPGTRLKWSYAHRARDVNANAFDVDTTAISFGAVPATGGGVNSGNAWSNAGNAGETRWHKRLGTYRVPVGQWRTRVALTSIDGGGAGLGNLLDAVKVTGTKCQPNW